MKELILSWASKIPYGDYLQNDYIYSVFLIVVAVVIAFLLLFIFSKWLQILAKKTKTEWDDMIFAKTKKPIFFFILIYGVKLALINLSFVGLVLELINTLAIIAFVVIISRAVDVTIETWGKQLAKKTKSKMDDVLFPMFHKAVIVFFVIIGILWVLSAWNIDITPYLAGAGILGLVIGFALQDSLKNILGGITLLLDKTYELGDKVKFDSGDVGTIVDIGLRSTKMRTYDNELIYVPNGVLANSRVQNYTRPSPKVRVNIDFGVEYGTNVGKVVSVVVKTLKGMDRILKEPEPVAQFISMGDSALNFKARFWVERWDMANEKKLEATEMIYNALNEAKIGIPFPTHTVYMKK